jgi:peptidoglycan/LPS O-acetylase OafA/YrhL
MAMNCRRTVPIRDGLNEKARVRMTIDAKAAQNSMTGAEPVRFEALDSWRGVAAILVVLFHAQVASHVRDAALVRAGEMLVDFFFVLSGFVIAYAYAGRVKSGADLGRFMMLRFGRVLPLHVVVLAAFIAMEGFKAMAPGLGAPDDAAFTGTNQIGAILTNLFLVQVGTHDQLTWNTPAWSIAAEIVAYAAFGVAALLLGRRLGLAALAGAVVSLAVLWAVAPHGMVSTHDFGDFRAIYGLSVGVLAHRLAMGGIVRLRAEVTDGRGRWRWTAVEVLTVAAALAFIVNGYGTDAAFAAPAVFGVVVLVFAVEGGQVSALMRTRPLVLLGTLSFSIYMVHMFIIMRMVNLARLSDKLTGTATVVPMGHTEGVDFGNLFAGDAAILAILGVTIAVSGVTYRVVEQPGRAWFRRMADRMFAGRAARQPARGRTADAVSR